MPRKKKSAKTKPTPQEVIADAKRALKKIEKDLELELKKIKGYNKAMLEHDWYRFN